MITPYGQPQNRDTCLLPSRTPQSTAPGSMPPADEDNAVVEGGVEDEVEDPMEAVLDAVVDEALAEAEGEDGAGRGGGDAWDEKPFCKRWSFYAENMLCVPPLRFVQPLSMASMMTGS